MKQKIIKVNHTATQLQFTREDKTRNYKNVSKSSINRLHRAWINGLNNNKMTSNFKSGIGLTIYINKE